MRLTRALREIGLNAVMMSVAMTPVTLVTPASTEHLTHSDSSLMKA